MLALRPQIAGIAILVALVASCGGRGQVVERSGQYAATAHAALNSARDSFVAWDAQHQLDIVERSTSLEQGQVMLAGYRMRRQKVFVAFQAAYGALAAVAVLIPLVESDRKSTAELIAAAAEAAAAVAVVREAISALLGEDD